MRFYLFFVKTEIYFMPMLEALLDLVAPFPVVWPPSISRMVRAVDSNPNGMLIRLTLIRQELHLFFCMVNRGVYNISPQVPHL